jgi:hypothetical protein
MKIFTDRFLNEDISAITKQVNSEGYYSFENALTEEFMRETEILLTQNKAKLNRNWPAGVNMSGQFFQTHLLTVSRNLFNYVCAEKIRKIASQILDAENIRLKAMRYYETYGRFHMQWHTDNKTDRRVAQIPGIIVICYLSDVSEGEFQYIKGSHKWSGEKAYSDYTDEYIERLHGGDVISFKKPKGSIIIYNTYGIHRASPVHRRNYIRKSIFFQIDTEINNGEPILLNPSFMDQINPEINTYLGFGLPSNYQIFPNSTLNDHPLYLRAVLDIAGWLAYRSFRGIYEIMPIKYKSKLKKILKFSNDDAV